MSALNNLLGLNALGGLGAAGGGQNALGGLGGGLGDPLAGLGGLGGLGGGLGGADPLSSALGLGTGFGAPAADPLMSALGLGTPQQPSNPISQMLPLLLSLFGNQAGAAGQGDIAANGIEATAGNLVNGEAQTVEEVPEEPPAPPAPARAALEGGSLVFSQAQLDELAKGGNATDVVRRAILEATGTQNTREAVSKMTGVEIEDGEEKDKASDQLFNDMVASIAGRVGQGGDGANAPPANPGPSPAMAALLEDD